MRIWKRAINTGIIKKTIISLHRTILQITIVVTYPSRFVVGGGEHCVVQRKDPCPEFYGAAPGMCCAYPGEPTKISPPSTPKYFLELPRFLLSQHSCSLTSI